MSAFETPRALDHGGLIFDAYETIAASAPRARRIVGLQFLATLGARE
jgi:hypothetical protein